MSVPKRQANPAFYALLRSYIKLMAAIPQDQRKGTRLPKQDIQTLRDYFGPEHNPGTEQVRVPPPPHEGTYSHVVLEPLTMLEVGQSNFTTAKRRTDVAPILARYMPDKVFRTHAVRYEGEGEFRKAIVKVTRLR